ncbi:hypothetical protein J0910_13645 [Nocardiopsis sp. CNT-189]|uniref:hypothetical protein n=1 Tax=Nocardiopsis oceanisediminis TaxID=2816862 RepID=UPI003B38F017
MSGPADPSRSEPTRLMCAGAYLDRGFRRAVIAELVERPERAVAPSLGFDAVPVLRHCLHARRLETEAGGRLVLLWLAWPLTALLAGLLVELLSGEEGGEITMGALVTTLLFMAGFAVLCLIGTAQRRVAGSPTGFYLADQDKQRLRSGGRAWPGLAFTAVVWTMSAVLWPALLGMVWFYGWETGGPALAAVLLLVCGAWPALIAGVVQRHRSRVDGILLTDLTPSGFTGAGPEVHPGYEPLLRAIAAEQYSSVVLYAPEAPFRGAGEPRSPWLLALELRPEPGSGAERRLTGRRLVDVIRKRVEALTERADEESRDRLTGLEVREQVFLPGPLPYGSTREQLPTGPEDRDPARRHVAAAVQEGGEQRRHFLRLRVGGWEEEVVTTVYVRAHCQGRMLLLEVAPHVLAPIADRFQRVDALPAWVAARGPFGRACTAVLLAPAASLMAVAALLSTAASGIRVHFAAREASRVEPPRTSLRELAADKGRISLFQDMDVARYTQTLHDRIGSAVRRSLVDAGYQSDEFQRHIVNIGAGGVFVGGSVSGGAIASGEGARAESGDGKSRADRDRSRPRGAESADTGEKA